MKRQGADGLKQVNLCPPSLPSSRALSTVEGKDVGRDWKSRCKIKFRETLPPGLHPDHVSNEGMRSSSGTIITVLILRV